jgi:hypothetical protein
MSEMAEAVEGETLDDLATEWQAEQAEADKLENQPDAEELEQARKLAERMNAGFLWVVNRTQCPHVNIHEIIEADAGVEAFEPLAERWGGEVPEWVQQFSPYIGAGVYMATTIVTARQVERQILDAHEKQQEGAASGEEPEHAATE